SRILVLTQTPAPSPAAQQPARPSSIDLSRGWQVTFQDSAHHVFEMDQLDSWVNLPGMEQFSGLADYEKQVEIPTSWVGLPAYLDFGKGSAPWLKIRLALGFQAWFDAPVREAAVVYINGQKAGSAWCPPYAVEVSRFLKPGTNTIKIEVGNLAMNS